MKDELLVSLEGFRMGLLFYSHLLDLAGPNIEIAKVSFRFFRNGRLLIFDFLRAVIFRVLD